MAKAKILKERDVALLLDIPLEQLEVIRQKKQLPFLSVDRIHRVYFESDIIGWLEKRRVVLGG